MITASWEGQDLPPADAEERLAEFAELLDTAIANADSRDQLTASRARVLTAGDEARRRVVRDLHDGAQQRLVHTIVTLKLAQRALGDGHESGRSRCSPRRSTHAEQGNAELRELAHGILPAVLTRGGLPAGVDSARRAPRPAGRRGRHRAAAAAGDRGERVLRRRRGADQRGQARAGDARPRSPPRSTTATLRVEVRDDGIGGADPEGHGLLGVSDRVAALGGRLRIDSPPGAGTVLAADLPLR